MKLLKEECFLKINLKRKKLVVRHVTELLLEHITTDTTYNRCVLVDT